jgi:hypothetical protein
MWANITQKDWRKDGAQGGTKYWSKEEWAIVMILKQSLTAVG